MRRQAFTTAFVLLAALTCACSHRQIPLPSPPPLSSESSPERGEYIVRNVAVCGGCHGGEPKNADSPLSGGREFRNWRIGTARASNLTPDAETGLGQWSEAEIVRAIRNGQSRSGRLLTPVMPYEWFNGMSDDDAFAVARYLKSLPPVRKEVKQKPNLMFKLGRALFLRPKSSRASSAPPRAATAAYGEYISQHVGLCADCHTQRVGLLQKPDRKRLFAGMDKPPEEFPARPPNLRPDRTSGMGTWTEEQFIATIRNGERPEGDPLHPFMPWRQLRRMTDEDLSAIYRYLKTLPPRDSIR